MNALSFVLKVGLITILIVLFMQIKVGEETIENQAHYYLRTSILTEPLDDIAKGGAALFRSAYRGAIKTFDSVVGKKFRSDDGPGNRELVKVQRSSKYQEEIEKRNQNK